MNESPPAPPAGGAARLLADRRLRWPGCHNVRDLGGLPTGDGGRIRRGALVRTDDLHGLTAEGLAALREYGVSRVLDLRNRVERAEEPSPLRDDSRYLATPFIDEEAERHRDPSTEPTLASIYLGSVERNGRTIAAAVAAFAAAPEGAVVVHCHAGKDRTGMFVALVLRLAGVAIDDIAADYALTAECLRERYDAELAAAPPAERERLRDRQSSDPDTIARMLDAVERRHGDVAAYLAAYGLTAGQIGAARARLLAG